MYGVNVRVNNSQKCIRSEQIYGQPCVRLCQYIDETGDQEHRDVFEIISVSSRTKQKSRYTDVTHSQKNSELV